MFIMRPAGKIAVASAISLAMGLLSWWGAEAMLESRRQARRMADLRRLQTEAETLFGGESETQKGFRRHVREWVEEETRRP